MNYVSDIGIDPKGQRHMSLLVLGELKRISQTPFFTMLSKLQEDQERIVWFLTRMPHNASLDELNHFFSKTGSVLTFGLNALTGRKRTTRRGLYVGNWDSTNAHDFIEYTVSKGYNIESWEFGNELTGDTGVAARVNAWQYGKDLIKLKEIISKIYHKYDKKQPKLLAPGGFYEPRWFADMLKTSGPNVVDAVTQHIYNLGAGVDRKLIYKIQNPHYLSRIASTYRHFSATIRNFGPWSAAWPGITVLLINLARKTAFEVSVASELSARKRGTREEYHLTPQGRNLRSHVMLLNGKPLNLNCENHIPKLLPLIAEASAPVRLVPLSIAFVRFKGLTAPACS
uniref:Heparanase-like protein 2 n=1 Tax=Ananas comosus var. bracteatus TaxID=296719 RepID=A0A6V7Q4I0_ANACO|nr:unnamed protein product [Ananas comosus var. bracteatus]